MSNTTTYTFIRRDPNNIDDDVTRWSNPANWQGGTPPSSGNVSNTTIIFDINNGDPDARYPSVMDIDYIPTDVFNKIFFSDNFGLLLAGSLYVRSFETSTSGTVLGSQDQTQTLYVLGSQQNNTISGFQGVLYQAENKTNVQFGLPSNIVTLNNNFYFTAYDFDIIIYGTYDNTYANDNNGNIGLNHILFTGSNITRNLTINGTINSGDITQQIHDDTIISNGNITITNIDGGTINKNCPGDIIINDGMTAGNIVHNATGNISITHDMIAGNIEHSDGGNITIGSDLGVSSSTATAPTITKSLYGNININGKFINGTVISNNTVTSNTSNINIGTIIDNSPDNVFIGGNITHYVGNININGFINGGSITKINTGTIYTNKFLAGSIDYGNNNNSSFDIIIGNDPTSGDNAFVGTISGTDPDTSLNTSTSTITHNGGNITINGNIDGGKIIKNNSGTITINKFISGIITTDSNSNVISNFDIIIGNTGNTDEVFIGILTSNSDPNISTSTSTITQNSGDITINGNINGGKIIKYNSGTINITKFLSGIITTTNSDSNANFNIIIGNDSTNTNDVFTGNYNTANSTSNSIIEHNIGNIAINGNFNGGLLNKVNSGNIKINKISDGIISAYLDYVDSVIIGTNNNTDSITGGTLNQTNGYLQILGNINNANSNPNVNPINISTNNVDISVNNIYGANIIHSNYENPYNITINGDFTNGNIDQSNGLINIKGDYNAPTITDPNTNENYISKISSNSNNNNNNSGITIGGRYINGDIILGGGKLTINNAYNTPDANILLYDGAIQYVPYQDPIEIYNGGNVYLNDGDNNNGGGILNFSQAGHYEFSNLVLNIAPGGGNLLFKLQPGDMQYTYYYTGTDGGSGIFAVMDADMQIVYSISNATITFDQPMETSSMRNNFSPLAITATSIPTSGTLNQVTYYDPNGNPVTYFALAQIASVCYSGESLVLTKNILTNDIKEIPVRDVLSNVHQVYSVNDKVFVPIKYNIITGPVKRYMLIKKNSLGPSTPNDDFYITSGHPVVINGKEVKARNVIGAKRVKVNSQPVYTICTENRIPILVNNMSVMTYSVEDWDKYAKKTNKIWCNNK